MPGRNLRFFISIAVFLIFTLVFLKNAWVSEDACITFRCVEQVFDGNGPRWNPHERVQAFTSPLWFWMLVVLRFFSDNLFTASILLSAAFCLAMLAALRFTVPSIYHWAALAGLMMTSNGFFDFTSSGLENPAAYLLLSVYLYLYFRIFNDPQRQPERYLAAITAVSGMMLVCRHDLLTLILIPTAYVLYSYRETQGPRQWTLLAVLGLAPLTAWSLFAFIYYGTPFPNTAYAKLAAGVPRFKLFNQGINYMLVSFRYDFATFAVIPAGICFAMLCGRKHIRVLCPAILLNLLYVTYIGGDFMQGRFLSFSFLIAATALVSAWRNPVSYARILSPAVFVLIAGYSLLYTHTPVNTPLDFGGEKIVMGVADERSHYFRTCSLWRYLNKDDSDIFPTHRYMKEGLRFSRSDKCCIVKNVVGMFGYGAGVDKIIIDPLGITDPLLARLPIPEDTHWRTGHFEREIPEGYIESVVTGENRMKNPALKLFYEKLRTVTQSRKLFSADRFKTILCLNLGRYRRPDPDPATTED